MRWCCFSRFDVRSGNLEEQHPPLGFDRLLMFSVCITLLNMFFCSNICLGAAFGGPSGALFAAKVGPQTAKKGILQGS